jgi:hypothetical protein
MIQGLRVALRCGRTARRSAATPARLGAGLQTWTLDSGSNLNKQNVAPPTLDRRFIVTNVGDRMDL